jgi:hypothetical protein
MVPPLNTTSLWRRLSVREIVGLLPRRTFSCQEKKTRAKLEEAVLQLPPDQMAVLEHASLTKSLSSKNAVDAEPYEHRSSQTNEDMAHFFETVSEECRHEHISKFIDATGNKATATVSCAVSAGSFFKIETKEFKLSHLPNHLLAPSKTHVVQILTEGMLLDTSPSSLRTDGDGIIFVNLCLSCTSDIQKKKKLRRYL